MSSDSGGTRGDAGSHDEVYSDAEMYGGDETYADDDRGDPALAGEFGEGSVDAGYMLHADGLLDPTVYGAMILGGLVLLVLPEPVSSVLGLVLVILGVFVAVVDRFTPE